MAIKRPPFDFEITEPMNVIVNEWVDYLEGKKVFTLPIDLVRMEFLYEARNTPGSGHTNDNDEWLLRYYLDGGWRHDVD